jgi:putative glutamine amidotransferase
MISIATPDFHYLFESSLNEEIPIISENESTVSDSKLIIFSGGEDINPEIYGEENRFSFFNKERDSVELKILEESLRLNKKILGVCRGHQLINAYLGGKMVQDLRKDLKINHGGKHKLKFLTKNSTIKDHFEFVNSMHHQGVIKAGKNLVPTSIHKGVLESCENENIITVQFHPEFMSASSFFNYIKLWKEI